jgi:hypothetical protein
MIDLSYIIQDRKRGNMKDLNWKRYHITRETLLMAIQNHLQSIGKVNVYNNVTNTSGDHSLMNEHMGTVEMNKLKERLTV